MVQFSVVSETDAALMLQAEELRQHGSFDIDIFLACFLFDYFFGYNFSALASYPPTLKMYS